MVKLQRVYLQANDVQEITQKFYRFRPYASLVIKFRLKLEPLDAYALNVVVSGTESLFRLLR